ncbi:MAG: hypothetical protein ACLR95_19890 [Enterococcus avium]
MCSTRIRENLLNQSIKNIKETSAARHWQHFLKTGEVAPDAPDYLKEAKRKIDFYSLKEDEQTMIMNINKTEAIRNCRAFNCGGGRD